MKCAAFIEIIQHVSSNQLVFLWDCERWQSLKLLLREPQTSTIHLLTIHTKTQWEINTNAKISMKNYSNANHFWIQH